MIDKEGLTTEIKEIMELVKLVPEPLQEKLFEMLVARVLDKTMPQQTPATGGGGSANQSQSGGALNAGGGDFGIPDEVLKRVRAFAGSNELTLDEIKKVFAFDDLGNVTIEAMDLKTAKTTQKQKRLALLVGLRHQFMGGSFDVPVDELREQCVTYASYDAANFAANLKSMADIFAGFKPGTTNKLSPVGKKEGAKLVKELASA